MNEYNRRAAPRSILDWSSSIVIRCHWNFYILEPVPVADMRFTIIGTKHHRNNRCENKSHMQMAFTATANSRYRFNKTIAPYCRFEPVYVKKPFCRHFDISFLIHSNTAKQEDFLS
jgi:hypothetical protein